MTIKTRKRSALLLATIIIILVSGGLMCTAFGKKMREQNKLASAGFNGGFEYFQDRLPANWIMYTPKTVKNADFDIRPDKDIKHEGAQSLRFDVRKCGAVGGWRSPGIDNEIPAEPGAVYEVKLWIKSDKAHVRISARAVNAFHEANVHTQDIQPADGDWHEYMLRCTIAEKMRNLRFELNVLSPGRVWVDDVRITRAKAVVSN